jgi:hypothetical protein
MSLGDIEEKVGVCEGCGWFQTPKPISTLRKMEHRTGIYLWVCSSCQERGGIPAVGKLSDSKRKGEDQV